MAKKPNPFLAQIKENHERDMRFMREFTIQQCEDMMIIAANRAFGFGADRAKVLVNEYRAVLLEYAKMTLDDAKDDKQIWYTKGKVDDQLKQICGDWFVPWEERYS